MPPLPLYYELVVAGRMDATQFASNASLPAPADTVVLVAMLITWLTTYLMRRACSARATRAAHAAPCGSGWAAGARHTLYEQRGGFDVDDLREDSPPADPAVYTDAHILYEFRVTGGARSRYFEGIVESVLPSAAAGAYTFPKTTRAITSFGRQKAATRGAACLLASKTPPASAPSGAARPTLALSAKSATRIHAFAAALLETATWRSSS